MEYSSDLIKKLALFHFLCWNETYRHLFFTENNFLQKREIYSFERYWKTKVKEEVFIEIVQSENQIQGFLIGKVNSDPAVLNALYVAKEFHFRGVGRKLLQSFTNQVFKTGGNSILIEVIEGISANNFYRKNGAVKVGSRQTILENRLIKMNQYILRL